MSTPRVFVAVNVRTGIPIITLALHVSPLGDGHRLGVRKLKRAFAAREKHPTTSL